MSDAVFASLGSGLRFKRPISTSTKPFLSSVPLFCSSNNFLNISLHNNDCLNGSLTRSYSQICFVNNINLWPYYPPNTRTIPLYSILKNNGKNQKQEEKPLKSHQGMPALDFFEQDDLESEGSGSVSGSEESEEMNDIDFGEDYEYDDSEDDDEGEDTPTNFVSARRVKLDGIDLPHVRLVDRSNPSKEELQLITVNAKNNVVTSKVTQFEQLGINDWLLKNIKNELLWTVPTHVQQMSVPALLAGRDLLVASPTGSGKTAGFLVPILQLLIVQKTQKSELQAPKPTQMEPKNVIVAPTTELVKQIFHQALLLATGQLENLSILHLSKSFAHKLSILRKKVSSSKSSKTDTSDSENSDSDADSRLDEEKTDEELKKIDFPVCDLLITTPSRLLQLVHEKVISLEKVEHLVLDEVDRLMTEEFLGQADEIIDFSKKSKQRRIAMFSATLLPNVEALAKTVLRDPIRARVGMKNIAAEHVKQHLKYVGSEEGKLMAIKQLLINGGLRAPVLLFLQSKSRTDQLLACLATPATQHITIDYITGDRTEAQRKTALKRFRSGEIHLLITTDLLARGLDFKAVATIINYDMPSSPTTYIHRIGRTGRVGGVSGEAWTFFTDADIPFLPPISSVMIRSGQKNNIPQWVLNVKTTKKQVLKPKRGDPTQNVLVYQNRPSTIERDAIRSSASKKRYINPKKTFKGEDQGKPVKKQKKVQKVDESKKRSRPKDFKNSSKTMPPSKKPKSN